MTTTVRQVHCLKCGHKWLPRTTSKPKWCPECGNPKWNEPRVRPKRAEQLANAQQRRLENATEILKQLSQAEIKKVVPNFLTVKTVTLKEVMFVPCGEAEEIETCLNEMGEGNEIEVSGRLAELATPNSFVARTSGMSMSNGDYPDGIGPDSQVMLIPFNEFESELRPGMVVLAKLKYKSGAVKCSLKEYTGKRLKARNPQFKGVDFGPDIKEATIWAICAGVVEKVLLNGKGVRQR